MAMDHGKSFIKVKPPLIRHLFLIIHCRGDRFLAKSHIYVTTGFVFFPLLLSTRGTYENDFDAFANVMQRTFKTYRASHKLE